MLVMFDPTTFPMTISEVPAKTLATEVASSGNEVPNAIIVTPIIKGEIPKERPISSAESMNQSAAFSKTAKLITKRPRYNTISIKYFYEEFCENGANVHIF